MKNHRIKNEFQIPKWLQSTTLDKSDSAVGFNKDNAVLLMRFYRR